MIQITDEQVQTYKKAYSEALTSLLNIDCGGDIGFEATRIALASLSHTMGVKGLDEDAESKLETIVAPDNGTVEEVLTAVLQCAPAWVPEARIVGNVRAGDIARAIRSALTPTQQPEPDEIEFDAFDYDAYTHAQKIRKVAAMLSIERMQGWANPLVVDLTNAADYLESKPKPVHNVKVSALASPQSVPGLDKALEKIIKDKLTEWNWLDTANGWMPKKLAEAVASATITDSSIVLLTALQTIANRRSTVFTNGQSMSANEAFSIASEALATFEGDKRHGT